MGGGPTSYLSRLSRQLLFLKCCPLSDPEQEQNLLEAESNGSKQHWDRRSRSEKVHEITALEAGGVGTTPKGTDLLRLYNGK